MVLLSGTTLRKSEREYYGKFGQNLGRIQHISIIIIIDIYYKYCCLITKTLAPTLPSFQVIERCIKCLGTHLHKQIFYPPNLCEGYRFIRLTWSGYQVLIIYHLEFYGVPSRFILCTDFQHTMICFMDHSHSSRSYGKLKHADTDICCF